MSKMSQLKGDYVVTIYSGKKDSSSGDIFMYIKLLDDSSKSTDAIFLNNKCAETSKPEIIESYKLSEKETALLKKTSNIREIKIWRDTTTDFREWYVTKVEIQNMNKKEKLTFPVYRMIEAKSSQDAHSIFNLNASLPPGASFGKKVEIAYLRALYKMDMDFSEQSPRFKEKEKTAKHSLHPVFPAIRPIHFQFTGGQVQYSLGGLQQSFIRPDTDTLDTSLPQDLPEDKKKERKTRLEGNRNLYQLDQKFPREFPGGPCQVETY